VIAKAAPDSISINNNKMTMTDSTAAKPPLGFTIVPPHLVAINLLTHIERMAKGKRSQTIHATSRKRHKFKQLQIDIIEWRKNPMMHIKELKAAYTEWRPAGIREITETPGQFMFSRAIVIPKEPPQLVVPKKMLVQKQLIPTQTRIRKPANLTVGTTLTAKTDHSDDTTPTPTRANPTAHAPELSFYSLADNTTGRDWASLTKASTKLPDHQQQQSETGVIILFPRG
jgi:hypothetical protein